MSAGSPLPRYTLTAAVAAVSMAAAAAVAVRALGAAPAARQTLDFSFAGPAREPATALDVAATNIQLVAAALLAALAVSGLPRLRRALDAALAVPLVLNTGAVGLTLGAYGPRTLDALLLHGPIELAAFALSGGAYLAARQGELSGRALRQVAAATGALVVAGAVVETYVWLGAES